MITTPCFATAASVTKSAFAIKVLLLVIYLSSSGIFISGGSAT